MKVRLWLLLSLFVSGITWLYATGIQEPWVDHVGLVHDGVKAQLGDLYPRWVGTRELLLRGRNPYSPEVSHEIQMAYYGHMVSQDYLETSHKIVDEQRFAYPVYVVFLMAPTMYVDFSQVHRWAPFVLGLLAALSVPLSLDTLRWRPPVEQIAVITLFVVCSPQIVQGLEHQQLAVVVGFLLIAGAWCVSRNHLAIGGMLLAGSALKPQMAFFPICFFLVWVTGNWRKRWRLLAGFVAMLAALIGAGELVLPGWIGYFLAGAAAYRRYFPTTSLLRIILGDMLGEIMGGIITLTLLLFAWRNRRETADSYTFATLFAGFLMGTILAFPLFTPFNQVLLIPPAMLLLHDWRTLPKVSCLVFIASTSWPWIISAALLLFPPHLNSLNQLPLLPSFLVPFFPLLLPLLLMTRRADIAVPHLGATDSRPS